MQLSAKAASTLNMAPRIKAASKATVGAKMAATPMMYATHGDNEDDDAPRPPAGPPPKSRAAAKPKPASRPSYNGAGGDGGPRPPPGGPPPKRATQPQPKGPGRPAMKPTGTPLTPMTPPPKGMSMGGQWAQPPADSWGTEAAEAPAAEEEEEQEAEEDAEWEAAPPPAKRFKTQDGQQWAEPGQQWAEPQDESMNGWATNGQQATNGQDWGEQPDESKGYGKGDKSKGDKSSGKGAKGKPAREPWQKVARGMNPEDVDGINDGLLPIQQRLEEVIAAVCGPSPVCCIGGDTGSGKSTQIPQIIFKDACDRMQEVKIAVIQPRRVAAISLAKRVSHELGEHQPGGLVGYRIGGESKPGYAIDFCSTGYFLQLLVNAPGELGRYSHVVLDEVHERSAESDLLCFVVRRLVSGPQKGVRVVIMSATVNMKLFSTYFSRVCETGDKPAEVFVGKKCFPVAEYFLEELLDAFPTLRCGSEISKRINDSFPDGLKKSHQWAKKPRLDPRHCEKFNSVIVELLRCLAQDGGTIIVFLPGIGEITAVWQEARLLQEGGAFEVMPLHSMIPQEEQQAVFSEIPRGKTRVILATDIAESSLTMPNICCVIDFGLHRRMDHGDKRSLASLSTKWIAQAAAKQRAGRAGRTQPGLCIRLYTENWFKNVMEEHEPPETQSMPLDRLYLQAKQLCEKLGQTSKIQRSAKAALLELVQSPDVSQIDSARIELADLGAIDSAEEGAKITRFGQLCAQVPLDLRLARSIWLGVLFGTSADAVVLAACLSTNDPFSFPAAHFARSEDDYAQWLRDTTATRMLFDGGLQSEPLMLRQLFLEWLVTLHETSKPYGTWKQVLQARRKHTEQFSKTHRLAKGRMEHIVSQILDLSLRTFHACAAGSRASKQLRSLIRVLGYSIDERGNLSAISSAEAGDVKAILHGSDGIFEENSNILRGLLAATFSDFLVLGSYSGGEGQEKGKGKQQKGGKDSKQKQLDLLKAVHDKEVNVHQTAWFGTQKDDPIVGIEKYVDHVTGRSAGKPQVVLEGKDVVFVEFSEHPEAWPQLRSKKDAGASVGSQYEMNLMNHYASAMREVQRWSKSSVEWSFGVHMLQHPHEIKWELMQPTFDWSNRPVRCMAQLERRNAVGFVTRTPVEDENFGNMRRVAVFGVASSVHGSEQPGRVYPVGTTILSACHIAFILTTAKFSHSQWGSRFGVTTTGSLSIMGNCIDLPKGLLTKVWWERIQKMRAAVRRELSNPILEHDENAALERACDGVAPLVLTDAEDVQQCMCALLEEAENFHGMEALEALEESQQTMDLVLTDPKDAPVAMQPLASWEDVENPGKKATLRSSFANPMAGGKGKFNPKGFQPFQPNGKGFQPIVPHRQQNNQPIQPVWQQNSSAQQIRNSADLRSAQGKGQVGMMQNQTVAPTFNPLAAMAAKIKAAHDEEEKRAYEEEEAADAKIGSQAGVPAGEEPDAEMEQDGEDAAADGGEKQGNDVAAEEEEENEFPFP